MEFLTEHPFFKEKNEYPTNIIFYFKEPFVLRLLRDGSLEIGWTGIEKQRGIKTQPEWFRELYVKSLLWLIEKRKMKVMLSHNTREKNELIEAYLWAYSVSQMKDIGDPKFRREYLRKAEDELGMLKDYADVEPL